MSDDTSPLPCRVAFTYVLEHDQRISVIVDPRDLTAYPQVEVLMPPLLPSGRFPMMASDGRSEYDTRVSEWEEAERCPSEISISHASNDESS